MLLCGLMVCIWYADQVLDRSTNIKSNNCCKCNNSCQQPIISWDEAAPFHHIVQLMWLHGGAGEILVLNEYIKSPVWSPKPKYAICTKLKPQLEDGYVQWWCRWSRQLARWYTCDFTESDTDNLVWSTKLKSQLQFTERQSRRPAIYVQILCVGVESRSPTLKLITQNQDAFNLA